MALSYFIWNGIDSRTMGITLAAPAPIVRGEERVEHVEIPGRAGDLTVVQGDGIFNSYIQTVTMSVEGSDRVRRIFRWLNGAGTITFSGEPDRVQDARVIGAVTLERVSRNIDRWRGEVQFYCQPFKRRLQEEQVILTESGILVNDGDVDEKPRILATITAGATVTVTSSSGTFTVDTTGLSLTRIVIDSETEEVTSEDGDTLLTGLSSGAFPRIAAEDRVTVGGSGWSRLTIDRRRRYL